MPSYGMTGTRNVYRNRYGHPSTKGLQAMYAAAGVQYTPTPDPYMTHNRPLGEGIFHYLPYRRPVNRGL